MRVNELKFNLNLRPELLSARKRELPLKWFFLKVKKEKEKNQSVIDIGTTIRPRLKEIEFLKIPIEIAEKESKNRDFYFNYSSSWGLLELRMAIVDYLSKKYQIEINPFKEIMITGGVSDALEKILQAFKWGGIILPSWSPSFVISQSIFKKIPIIRLSINYKNGDLNLEKIERRLHPTKKWLLWINHPSFLTGTLMEDNFIEKKLFPFCQKYNVFICSETYFHAKRLDQKPFRPLLSFPRAKEFCVEIMGLHREFGTPGIRVSAVVGNEEMVNLIRIISSLNLDLVPFSSQLAMGWILRYFLEHNNSQIGIEEIVRELKEEIVPRLKNLNWPYILPKAGLEMRVKVPPNFIKKEIKDPSLFSAFVFLKRYQIAFAPGSIFCLHPSGRKWLIISLRQQENQIPQALERMRKRGFCWEKVKPTKKEIEEFNQEIKQIDLEFFSI